MRYELQPELELGQAVGHEQIEGQRGNVERRDQNRSQLQPKRLRLRSPGAEALFIKLTSQIGAAKLAGTPTAKETEGIASHSDNFAFNERVHFDSLA